MTPIEICPAETQNCEPGVKRLVTLPVFDAVKLGLHIPVRRTAGR